MIRESDPVSVLVDAPQRSAQWLYERCGKVTASRFKDVLAKLKNGDPAKARSDYLWEIVVERLTGTPSDHFTNSAMQWGTDQEQAAKMAYEGETGAMIEEVGFIQAKENPLVGGSPDGLIGEDGGIEIKCPFNSAIHLQTILNGMPDEHAAQVQGLMWITNRAWWDFVSFDPRMPADLRLYRERIMRDEDFIANLESEVTTFLIDVEAKIRAIREAA